MAWITPSETHLRTRLSGPEIQAFKTAALASGQSNPIPDLLEEVVNRIRGDVAACEQNVLGPDGTIPDKLLGACLSIAVIEVMARAAGTVLDPEQARREAARNAERLLERVAACKFAIDVPDVQSDEVIQGNIPTFSGRTPVYTRDDQDGI
jgi:hypothetical protein